MNRFIRRLFPSLLAIAGFVCGCFVPAKDLVWVVWLFPAAAVSFFLLDMQLIKKKHA